MSVNISIGITTFENRYEKYFVPLLSKIREYDSETEIIVTINGENKKKFGELYRKRILQFISEKKNIFPIFFPQFRGLSKLWNTIIIHATGDYILILNDDIMINDPKFLKKIIKAIKRNNHQSFIINKSWSHFVISREEIDRLGYCDERLIGIGEEDGDITWRYLKMFGKPIPSFYLRGFVNYAQETLYSYKPINIKTHSNTKYSFFNRNYMFNHKYKKDPNGFKGIFDYPVTIEDVGPVQYPNERFYLEHKDEL